MYWRQWISSHGSRAQIKKFHEELANPNIFAFIAQSIATQPNYLSAEGNHNLRSLNTIMVVAKVALIEVVALFIPKIKSELQLDMMLLVFRIYLIKMLMVNLLIQLQDLNFLCTCLSSRYNLVSRFWCFTSYHIHSEKPS